MVGFLCLLVGFGGMCLFTDNTWEYGGFPKGLGALILALVICAISWMGLYAISPYDTSVTQEFVSQIHIINDGEQSAQIIRNKETQELFTLPSSYNNPNDYLVRFYKTTYHPVLGTTPDTYEIWNYEIIKNDN